MKKRLDQELFERGLVQSRSQGANLIKLKKVKVNGELARSAHQMVDSRTKLEVAEDTYVSRAGNKLASVATKLRIDFKDKLVLDVGSSTGGFTDYSLRHGASRVIAVEVGTDQLHPSLRKDPRIELFEKTDIRSVEAKGSNHESKITLKNSPDIILIDVSFISLRDVLPHIKTLCHADTQVVAMFKPQFEAGEKLKNKGVVKNDRMRRELLKDFESWVKQDFVVQAKADSDVSGQKGNVERFYLLRPAVTAD